MLDEASRSRKKAEVAATVSRQGTGHPGSGAGRSQLGSGKPRRFAPRGAPTGGDQKSAVRLSKTERSCLRSGVPLLPRRGPDLHTCKMHHCTATFFLLSVRARLVFEQSQPGCWLEVAPDPEPAELTDRSPGPFPITTNSEVQVTLELL